jgi:hypothetical protein
MIMKLFSGVYSKALAAAAMAAATVLQTFFGSAHAHWVTAVVAAIGAVLVGLVPNVRQVTAPTAVRAAPQSAYPPPPPPPPAGG